MLVVLPSMNIMIYEAVLICLVFLQNPNALDSKVTLDFDHVKKGLKLDDEGKLVALPAMS